MSQGSERSAILARCNRVARSQHGIIALSQALDAGLSIWSVRRMTRSGFWLRTHPGVLALWTPHNREGMWRQRLMSAVLWLGANSEVSHAAGGILWGVDGIESAPVELSTTSSRRSTRPGELIHRVRSLPSEEITSRDGIPVTAPARTVVDLAAVLGRKSLEIAVESAIYLGITGPEEIAQQLDKSAPTVAGSRALREILKRRPTTATQSVLETHVWWVMVDADLPAPVRQYEIHDEFRIRVARVDFAYPEARIAIEADGYRFHSRPTDWRKDRARQNALTRLGWVVYRVTWEDITLRPGVVVSDVARLLASRAVERGE